VDLFVGFSIQVFRNMPGHVLYTLYYTTEELFYKASRPVMGSNQTSCPKGSGGSFSGAKASKAFKLNTQLHIVPRVRFT
jgi:hypothetical protein